MGATEVSQMVSKRLQEIPASGTIAISNLVSQMKSEGIDIVSFSMGEPDFTTPENIIDACCDSLHRGFTHYTPSMGIPELRKAIADMTRTNNNVPCDASNVLVTPCKQAIFMTMLAYIDPGDEVILADPSWVSYEACVRLAGGVPVYVPTRIEDDFVLDPAMVEAAITPRTKMIILNTPSNPTGAVFPAEVLKQIADIAMAHGIKVFSDEIYEAIVYEGKHTSIASFPGMFENTIIVSGLSKSYAMTGWRLGWAIAPKEDIANINKLQSHSISCCVSFTQEAAVEAITGPQDSKLAMVREFRKRRDLALDLISAWSATCPTARSTCSPSTPWTCPPPSWRRSFSRRAMSPSPPERPSGPRARGTSGSRTPRPRSRSARASPGSRGRWHSSDAITSAGRHRRPASITFPFSLRLAHGPTL